MRRFRIWDSEINGMTPERKEEDVIGLLTSTRAAFI
jgi:hypothetical protein